MATIEISLAGVDAAERALAADTPVMMVNLLRYREQAQYDGGTLPPCSGREAYFQRYVPTFAAVTQGQGISAEWVGAVHAALVAPGGEAWDDVAIVRYPSVAAFRAMIESDAYRNQAAPHRLAALADWRLLATTPLALPGAKADDAA